MSVVLCILRGMRIIKGFFLQHFQIAVGSRGEWDFSFLALLLYIIGISFQPTIIEKGLKEMCIKIKKGKIQVTYENDLSHISLTLLIHRERYLYIHPYVCTCVYMQKANRVFPCWAWYFFVRIYTIVGKCARVYVCLLAWYVYLCDVCFGWYVSWLTTRRWPDLKRTNELGEKGKRSNRKSVQRNYNDHWHACMYVNVYVCMWLFVR